MAINEVRLQGGLTRDPDFKYGEQNGTPVWKTTLAVNGTKYDPQTRAQVVKTSFALIVAFGYKAEELLAVELGKGDELYVRGELDQAEWENKETGKKEHRTQVVIQGFDVVRKRSTRTGPPTAGIPAPADDPWATPGPQFQPDSEPPF